MAIKTSEAIIKSIFPDFDEKMFLRDGKTYRSAEWAKVPLSYFRVENDKKHDISGSFVWVPKQSIGNIKARVNFVIGSPSRNATFAILRTPNAGKQTFVLKGDGIRVLCLSHVSQTYNARLMRTSSLIIGEDTFIGSARFALVDTDLTIGADGLWSDEVIVQGADQHGLVDLSTNEITNGGRKFVTFERHVWVGRRAIVNKNVNVGSGSIIGTGAIVTKSVPPAAVVAGNPAKIVKRGITWSNSPEGPVPREEDDIAAIRKSARSGPVDGVTPPSPPTTYMSGLRASGWIKFIAAGALGASIVELVVSFIGA